MQNSTSYHTAKLIKKLFEFIHIDILTDLLENFPHINPIERVLLDLFFETHSMIYIKKYQI